MPGTHNQAATTVAESALILKKFPFSRNFPKRETEGP